MKETESKIKLLEQKLELLSVDNLSIFIEEADEIYAKFFNPKYFQVLEFSLQFSISPFSYYRLTDSHGNMNERQHGTYGMPPPYKTALRRLSLSNKSIFYVSNNLFTPFLELNNHKDIFKKTYLLTYWEIPNLIRVNVSPKCVPSKSIFHGKSLKDYLMSNANYTISEIDDVEQIHIFLCKSFRSKRSSKLATYFAYKNFYSQRHISNEISIYPSIQYTKGVDLAIYIDGCTKFRLKPYKISLVKVKHFDFEREVVTLDTINTGVFYENEVVKWNNNPIDYSKN